MHLRGGTEEFTINSIRRGIAAAGVVALITAGAAACGGDDEPSTPRGKVTNAFTKLGEQKAVTFGLSFDATGQQIYDAVKGTEDNEDFTLDEAKLLAGLHIKAGFSSDTPLGQLAADSKDKSNSVLLEVTSGDGSGAKHLIGVRSVNGKVYLQADIKGITALDESNSDLADVNGMLASVDQLPASFGSVKALVHGEWVSIDIKSFEGFIKSLGGGSANSDSSGDSDLGLPSDLPTALPSDLTGKTVTQLIAPLQKALAKDATLTDRGSKDGADHIKATIPARLLAKDLKSSLDSLGSLSKKAIPSDVTDSLDDVPNTTVSLDLALKNGELSAITVDMAQFDDTMKGSVPLVVSIEGSAAQIDAPKGAKQLNPQDVMGAVMQLMGGEDGSDA
jgi:hypothetical protein